MTIALEALDKPQVTIEVPDTYFKKEEDFLTPVEVVGIVSMAISRHAQELQDTYRYGEQEVIDTNVTLMQARRELVGQSIASRLSELKEHEASRPYAHLETDVERWRMNDLREVIVDAELAEQQTMPQIQANELELATTALELEAFAGSVEAQRVVASSYMTRAWTRFAPEASMPVTVS